MNRRKMFETSGRWFSTIILSSLAGYLVLRRKISAPAACHEQSICKQCLKFKGCDKPQAMDFRHHFPKADNIKR